MTWGGLSTRKYQENKEETINKCYYYVRTK